MAAIGPSAAAACSVRVFSASSVLEGMPTLLSTHYVRPALRRLALPRGRACRSGGRTPGADAQKLHRLLEARRHPVERLRELCDLVGARSLERADVELAGADRIRHGRHLHDRLDH